MGTIPLQLILSHIPTIRQATILSHHLPNKPPQKFQIWQGALLSDKKKTINIKTNNSQVVVPPLCFRCVLSIVNARVDFVRFKSVIFVRACMAMVIGVDMGMVIGVDIRVLFNFEFFFFQFFRLFKRLNRLLKT